MFSILLAHDPDKENIQWKDYTRFGVVNNGTINETGLATYYRIKRVTQNTFRDLRFFGHFFSSYPDFRLRAKSSNKYDFNKPLKPLHEQIKNDTTGLNKVIVQ